MSDIAFAVNSTNIVEIDTTPDKATPTWEWVGPGIKEIKPNGNETVTEDDYWTGKAKDVTGGQLTYEVKGDRLYGDPAQDYVQSLGLSYGSARRSKVRITHSNGDTITSGCTLTDIVPGSSMGASSAKGEITFGIACEGSPIFTEANKLELPDTVAVTDATVKVGATATLAPTVTPVGANEKCLFGIDNKKIATVTSDGVITGVSVGETTVTVKCAVKPLVSKQVKVTVTAAGSAPAKV
ncbi:MAG: Ig-like domain-containing protein [Raoultibacter sp.]|uniref:phage tail tube protein n=1 Tax=Gordonibacter sp. TaxID=1968902 RepID=UPI003063FA10